MEDDRLQHLLADQTRATADRLIGVVTERHPRRSFNWLGAAALCLPVVVCIVLLALLG